MDTKKIAEERIKILFQQAEEKFDEDPELSRRYVEIARRIGERTQVPIPSELQKKFCSSCNNYLKPGKNCRVRLNSQEELVEYTCGECGEVEKYGYRN
ncbi:MAG: ribonuclease P protein component 4 [Candidatus Nanohalobium sp.]